MTGGKGSGRRPQEVSDQEFADSWNTIFGPSLLERKRRQEALDEMVRISQELGLYNEFEIQHPKKPATGA